MALNPRKTVPWKLCEEAVDLAIDLDVTFADRFFEADALEGTAAAQGDIGLTRGEASGTEIDRDTVEGLSLALVDRDSPGEFEWNLLKRTRTLLGE